MVIVSKPVTTTFITPIAAPEAAPKQAPIGEPATRQQAAATHAGLGSLHMPDNGNHVTRQSRSDSISSTNSETESLNKGFTKVADVGAHSVKANISNTKKMTNEQEAQWRSEQKYGGVISQVRSGLDNTLDKVKNSGPAKTLLQNMGNEPAAKYPRKTADGPIGETRHFLKKALDCLNHPETFATKREAHQAFKEAQRQALNSEGYKNNPNSPEAQLLNCLCASEFTQVNLQELTQEFAESKSGIKSEVDGQKGLELFENSVDPGLLNTIHKGVGNQESTGQKVKSEVLHLKLDSLTQGNPANVKAKVFTKGNREVIDVRTPTPTDGNGDVVPEFKAFLRFLQNCEPPQKYTMVNLQNRVSLQYGARSFSDIKKSFKKAFDCNGEHVRSTNLEALATEFPDVINVFTLDKNSHFFHQNPTKKELEAAIESFGKNHPDREKWLNQLKHKKEWGSLAEDLCAKGRQLGNSPEASLTKTKKAFEQEFMDELMDPEKGFHLPKEFREGEGKDKVARTASIGVEVQIG